MANPIIFQIREQYTAAMQTLASQKGANIAIKRWDPDQNPGFHTLRLPGAGIIALQGGVFNLVVKRAKYAEDNPAIFTFNSDRARYARFTNEAILGKFKKEDLIEHRGRFYFKQELLSEVMDWVLEVQGNLLPSQEVTEADISQFIRNRAPKAKAKKSKLTSKLNETA